jgi:AcrR family transcriptional regulator
LNEPKTQKGKETLEKICNSAEELFSTKGYYNTSINDITRMAEIASGTFYIYFKDKLSVFQYLIRHLNHILREEINDSIKDCKTRYEKEHEGFKAFFNFLKHHMGLFKIIWEAQFVDEESFRNYYENIAKGYIRGIEEAQRNGEVADDISAKTLSYCFIGISNFIGLKWIIFDNEAVPDDVIDDLMKFFKNGAFK